MNNRKVNFRVFLPAEIYLKLLVLAKHSEVECAGLLCGKTHDNSIEVEDAVLLRQEGSMSNVKIDDSAIQKFMIEDGRKVVGWFHLHLNNQPPFFSQIDHKTSNIFAQAGFCLSIVINRKGEYRASVYHKSSSFDIIFEQPVILEFVFDKEFEESVRRELHEKVRKSFQREWYYGDGFLQTTGYHQP